MVIKDFYRQRHAPEDREFALEEYGFAMTENDLPKLIAKFTRDDKSSVTPYDVGKLNAHITLQHLRVPKIMAFIEKTLQTRAAPLGSITDVHCERQGDPKRKRDAFSPDAMRTILADGMYPKYFSRMIWNVWRMPSSFPSITTDNPVTIFNPSHVNLRRAGIGLIGSVVAFPLGPNHCLELIHPEREQEGGFDPFLSVEPPEVQSGHMNIRFGKEMPQKKAEIITQALAENAHRWIVASDRSLLERLWPSLGNIRENTQSAMRL